MMRFYIFLIVFLTSFNLFAQAELNMRIISAEEITVSDGDIFSSTLQVYPVPEYFDSSQYKKMVGTKILNTLFVTSVGDAKRNENNADVIEMNVDLAVAKYLPERLFYNYQFNNILYKLSLKNIQFKELKDDFDKNKQNFILKNQSYRSRKEIIEYFLYILIITILVLAVAVTRVLLVRKKKRLLAQNSKNDLIAFWNDKFQQANQREDFELIYSKRKIWFDLIEVETPDILSFYAEVNKVQFKKEWSALDNESIEGSFDMIRDIFRQKYGI